MAVPAFAAGTIQGDGSGSDSTPVTATFENPTTSSAGAVYYVTVAWEAQTGELKYAAGNTVYTWNGATMQYEAADEPDDAGWKGDASVKVTVTNQSNASVTAKTTWESDYNLAIAYEEANATSNDGEAVLTTAAVSNGQAIEITNTETTGTAQTVDITCKITATDASKPLTQTGTVGTITVTIAAAE